jgi:hypothetical protein
MDRHWEPEGKVIAGPWGRPGDYLPRRRLKARSRALPALVLGAVFAGVAGWAAWQSWRSQPVETASASAIEWNAVQAVPTRVPDAEDIAWEQRAKDEGSPSTSSGQTVEVVRGSGEASGEAGLPRASGARNDGMYVIDGDTFVMGRETVRIAGIDAPETHPPRCMDEARLGLAATQKLRQLLGSGNVAVSGTIHDRYGRDVRQVTVGGRDVAEIMIGAGLVRSYNGKKRQPWC